MDVLKLKEQFTNSFFQCLDFRGQFSYDQSVWEPSRWKWNPLRNYSQLCPVNSFSVLNLFSIDQKNEPKKKTIPFHRRLLQRRACGWNYCEGKIEDKQVQSAAVNETQSVLLLQGNISAFCVIVQKWLDGVCVLAVCKISVCVFYCVCTWFSFSLLWRHLLLSLKVSVCVCVFVCVYRGCLVWQGQYISSAGQMQFLRLFLILPPGSAALLCVKGQFHTIFMNLTLQGLTCNSVSFFVTGWKH